MTDLRRLAEAATPGPWYADDTSETWGDFLDENDGRESTGWFRDCGLGEVDAGDFSTLRYADAAYIAAASPDRILALLDERDAAIAHDTQPYPTVWAYEQACRALADAEAEVERLRAGDERGHYTAGALAGAAAERARILAAVEGLPTPLPDWQSDLVYRSAVIAALKGETT
jgi:hypothetical protein